MLPALDDESLDALRSELEQRCTALCQRVYRAARATGRTDIAMAALGKAGLDIRDLLPKVDVPTLVIHRTHEQWVDVGNSRYLAAHISGAQLVETSGVDHRPWLGDADEVLDVIETFVTGTVARPRTARYAAGAEALSRREREIVALTLAGETAPAIARALFLSERTVESHLARAYAKLGVHSKLELTRCAAEFGLAADSI